MALKALHTRHQLKAKSIRVVYHAKIVYDSRKSRQKNVAPDCVFYESHICGSNFYEPANIMLFKFYILYDSLNTKWKQRNAGSRGNWKQR